MTANSKNKDANEPISELEKQIKALEIAHDIRKFEIELYWKRATYFWAFIASIFAGFLFLLRIKSTSMSEYQTDLYLLLVTSLGLLFSIAWYCVNRGSKHWQKNWEIVITEIEYEITGALIGSHITNDTRLKNLLSSYPFSVSKINQFLALIVTIFWIFIWITSVYNYLQLVIISKYYFIPIVLIVLGVMYAIRIILKKCISENNHLRKEKRQFITYEGLFNRDINK